MTAAATEQHLWHSAAFVDLHIKKKSQDYQSMNIELCAHLFPAGYHWLVLTGSAGVFLLVNAVCSWRGFKRQLLCVEFFYRAFAVATHHKRAAG